MRHLIAFLIALAALVAAADVHAANTGAQAIGLANFTDADVRELADLYARVDGNVELSFLPFEFNPDDPFGNATAFAERLLPRLNGRLTLTAYLYFHNYACADRFEWSAFKTGSLSSGEAAFRRRYLARVRAFDRWAAGLQEWAAARRLQGRLKIVLCPFLEDDCRRVSDYQNLLRVIAEQQRADGVSTALRRSSDKHNIFRVGNLPLELHGKYDEVRSRLRDGDVFSNDGNHVWLDAATVPGATERPSSSDDVSCRDFIRPLAKVRVVL